MSFREKSAWIALTAYAVVFGGYFLTVSRNWEAARSIGPALLFGAVIGLIAVVVVLTVIAAMLSPKEAEAPADERERLIDLKAERIGSFTLSVGVVTLIGALLVGWSGFLVANLLLAAMVIAELAKAVAQIAYYRAGA